MEFDKSFEVPLPPAEAWTLLMDIERIVPCLPGAELTEIVDAQTYKGKVSVRLGPVALTFAGQARFEEMDDVAHTARVKAQGTDAKGRGGANADVTFALVPAEPGSRVDIYTNLQLSGSVAQYGRGVGMVSDLAGHLIGQFADCLRKRLEETEGAAAAPAAGEAAPAAVRPAPVLGIGLRVLWNALVRSIRRLFGGA